MTALLLLAASLASAAPAPAPTLALSTTTAELGTPVAAAASAPPGFALDLAGSTTDTFAITAPKEAQKGPDGGAVWPLTIIPLAVGRLPIALRWRTATGEAVSNAELVVTEPVMPDNADVADIKKPARARPLIWPWILALLLIGAAVYAWVKRNRRKTDISLAVARDLRTPAQRALDELSALERQGLGQEGRFGELYFRLTEILRGYLEGRYHVPALKLTTYELARQLRRDGVERQALAAFKELFDRADLIKFAKTKPEPGQDGLDLAAARRFVEATAPADLAAPPAPAEVKP